MVISLYVTYIKEACDGLNFNPPISSVNALLFLSVVRNYPK